MTLPYDCDVLIVGTGPTGATAALELATLGLRVQAISQWNWLANSPRAHVINQRANEVFRDLGVETDIRAKATPWDMLGDTTFATSLTGPEIARLRTWGTGDARRSDYLQGSPCPLNDLGQPQVEAILVDAAAARGAKFSFATEYIQHHEDDNGVTVTLRDRSTDHTYSLRAKYLIGADGARSRVAAAIGLEIVGDHARAGQIYARFNADLSAHVAHRPAVLHYIVNARAGYGELGMGVIRAVRPWDQWMAGWGFDMTTGGPDLDHDRALERIRALVGDPDLDAEIEWVAPWYVNDAYATTYGNGRVYCGGDAVHRHPPSSGLGSNTCIQDAHNLAWKLAYVVKGWATPRLLDSYTAERAPVGKQIVRRANQSRYDYAPLRNALGADGTPEGLAAGLAKLNERTEQGALLREDLAKALELKNHEFNAQGVELNQRYDSHAVIQDSAGEEVWRRDRELYLQATTRPGAHLPHAWLVDARGRKTSTLDVTGHGKFSVITGLSGTAWETAVDKLDCPWLRAVVIGGNGAQDLYGDWSRLREIEEAGALLVRPDGIVAWRHTRSEHDPVHATELLADALRSILGATTTERDATAHSTEAEQPRFLDTTRTNEGALSS